MTRPSYRITTIWPERIEIPSDTLPEVGAESDGPREFDITVPGADPPVATYRVVTFTNVGLKRWLVCERVHG